MPFKFEGRVRFPALCKPGNMSAGWIPSYFVVACILLLSLALCQAGISVLAAAVVAKQPRMVEPLGRSNWEDFACCCCHSTCVQKYLYNSRGRFGQKAFDGDAAAELVKLASHWVYGRLIRLQLA